MSRLDRIVGRSRGQQYESAQPGYMFTRVGPLILESANPPCSACRRPTASDPPLPSLAVGSPLGDGHKNSKGPGRLCLTSGYGVAACSGSWATAGSRGAFGRFDAVHRRLMKQNVACSAKPSRLQEHQHLPRCLAERAIFFLCSPVLSVPLVRLASRAHEPPVVIDLGPDRPGGCLLQSTVLAVGGG